eukprot:6903842-Lingulodinium_polyedra.AAC.1
MAICARWPWALTQMECPVCVNVQAHLCQMGTDCDADGCLRVRPRIRANGSQPFVPGRVRMPR